MRKKIIFALILIITFSSTAYAGEPDIKATAAVLAMADGEQIIYDKNPHGKVYPSGLTKLMTALVAYNKCGTDEVITVSENISDYISPFEQTMTLKAGEKIISMDLIKAIITGSANDAAITLALHCGGTIEGFAAMMNEQAKALGLSETNFVNPTGVHDAEQYTSAYDLLSIYKKILSIPKLKTIAESEYSKTGATDKNAAKTFWSGNGLATRYYGTKYYYPYAKGGKASSSSAGGCSVITGAAKGGIELICIVADSVLDESVNYSFIDAKALFEYGFNGFSKKTITNRDSIIREIKVKNAKGTDRTLLLADNTLKCLIQHGDTAESVQGSLSLPDFLSAPIKKGDIIGSIQYSYRGKYAGTVFLAAGNNLDVHPVKFVLSSIGWFFSLKYIKLFLAVVIAAIIIYIGIVILIISKSKKKKKKRKVK